MKNKIVFKEWENNYDQLMESFDFEILLNVEQEDYQGDSLVLFKNKNTNEIGFLKFGWGSCSGCDALQGCESQQDLDDLQKELYDGIIWYENFLLFKNYFFNKDWSTEWIDSDLIKEFTKQLNGLKNEL